MARIGREADRETREFLVDVRVNVLPRNWAVGQRAEVFIETGRRDSALLVPMGFLVWRSGKPGVFTVEDGKARWRHVQLGLRGLDALEVLEGLPPGAVVCKPRQAGSPVSDGQRVIAP